MSDATETRGGLPVRGFPDRAALEAWLSLQPPDASGIWLKLAKQGVAGVTRSEAIDAALCHGWIDGQAGRYDDHHWLIRYTPRRARSRWSQVNRTRALELIDADEMRPGGLAQIDAARSDGRWDAAYAPASTATVPADLRAALDADPAAAAFFATLAGASRYAILYRIAAVKRPETRARKIADYVAMCARRETIHG